MAASRGEATGLLVFPGPDYDGEPYPERFADSLRWLRKGSVSFVEPREEGADDERASARPRAPAPTAQAAATAARVRSSWVGPTPPEVNSRSAWPRRLSPCPPAP